MSERVTVREKGATDGCPFCRDVLHEDDDVWRCGSCDTRLHAACFRENGRSCTVLGCGARVRTRVAPEVAPPPPPAAPPESGRRESKRERKRRLREEHRAQRQAKREVDSGWTPATQPVPSQSDAPWFQGPIGLAAILSLVFIAPPLLREGGVVGLAVVAGVALCALVGWLVYTAAQPPSR